MTKKIVLAFALVLALSIAVSYAAYKFPVLPFDQASYDELHEKPRPFFGIVMQAVSMLGNMPVPILLTFMAIAFFAFRRQWLEALFMLLVTSNVLLAFALKDIIRRARPFPVTESTAGIVQSINQYSYPSGHVLFFVVFFGFFAYLAWMNFKGRARIIVIAICAALIILIGPSRVYLGAHWTSDVVGSYVIGIIWLSILIFAHQLVIHRKIDNPQ
jgi:membrane-associated phospholipid phosphatase